MVASDDGGRVLPHPVGRSIRIGTVAHDISAAEDTIVAAVGVREDRFQRLPVGVNVADDQVTHKRFDTVSHGGAPLGNTLHRRPW
jgi:hypothetical protein